MCLASDGIWFIWIHHAPMPRIAIALFLGALFGLVSGIDCLAAQATPGQPPDASSMMQRFLSAESRRLDSHFLDGITNRSQWEAQRAQLRQQYLEMLGLWPLPERTPLQAQITAVLEREEGFRVENLHFQSRAQLYVTGNLYLPRHVDAGAKLPAVLYVCGHSGRDRDG